MSMTYRVALKPKYTKNYWSGQAQWPPYWPEQNYIDNLKAWCKERVGQNGWNYYGMYRKVPYEFRFKRKEDLLAFKMTFGLHHDANSYTP